MRCVFSRQAGAICCPAQQTCGCSCQPPAHRNCFLFFISTATSTFCSLYLSCVCAFMQRDPSSSSSFSSSSWECWDCCSHTPCSSLSLHPFTHAHFLIRAVSYSFKSAKEVVSSSSSSSSSLCRGYTSPN